MKLYTINATPWNNKEEDDVQNLQRVKQYPAVVAALLKQYGIDGFTIYQVQGYWKGKAEISFKIEIATEFSDFMVSELARELRDLYKQEGVMVTFPDNTVDFI